MTKVLKTFPLLLIMLFAPVGPAFAQSSWLPSYSSSQKVYVAPGVDANLAHSFSETAFWSNVGDAARAHNIDVYVIITASGNDAGSDARQTGPVLVRKLWDNWTNSGAFKSDRALIILMTGDGQTLTSVGVRAGGYLNQLGIQRATMNDRNGPVMPVLRTYLASDPVSIPTRIVNNINAIVTSKNTPPATVGSGNQPISGSTEGDTSMGFGTILLIASGIILVLGAFIIAARPRRPNTTYTSNGPTARTTSLRKPGSGFEGRLSGSRRNSGTPADTDVDGDATRRNNDSINTAAAAGAGVVAGVLLADATRRKGGEPRRDTSSSDSGYVAPVSAPSCSTPSAPSCSSSSSSSSGSSCGGGGGGGGGCGGGGF